MFVGQEQEEEKINRDINMLTNSVSYKVQSTASFNVYQENIKYLTIKLVERYLFTSFYIYFLFVVLCFMITVGISFKRFKNRQQYHLLVYFRSFIPVPV